MTLQTLVWIIIWLFILVLVAGIVLVTFLFGRISVKDKPNEAAIFIKTGLHIQKPIVGKSSNTSRNGSSFMYSKNKVVFIPTTYKENYYHNRRMVFINHKGQLIASPIVDDVTLSETEKEDLIYEMCASHIGADGMRALKGKSTASIIIVAFAAFVIGIAVVISYNAFQEQAAKRQANAPQQQIEQPVPVEVR